MMTRQKSGLYTWAMGMGLFSLVLGLCSCGGSSGGSSSGITPGAKAYSTPSPNLYTEVPAIEITGGASLSTNPLFFNPKSPQSAELYDSDDDGLPDEPINDMLNYVNAANRMFWAEIAPCYGNNTGPKIWTTAYQPDTMPFTAGAGVQYIQLDFPFPISSDSIFDTNLTGFNYLRGSIVIIDEDNLNVNCTVLLDGKDAFGNDYTAELESLNAPITISPEVLLIFAQTLPDQATGSLPLGNVAFCNHFSNPVVWQASKNEIRIRVGQVEDTLGNAVDVNASYYVAKTNFDKSQVLPNLAAGDIIAWDVLGQDTETIDPDTGLPFTSPNNLIVSRTTNFALTFNKPVVPETVARSLIFDRPPFNGNTKVVISELAYVQPVPSPCPPNPPPIATNISISVQYIDQAGKSQTKSVIPFRCHPLHQNNLAAYVIDPLMELPGSTPDELNAANPLTMRVEVSVYPAGSNSVSGDPDDAGFLPPNNLAPCSFFNETYTGGGGVVTRSFTIEKGGRYVNSPVSPNALYYSMGPKGIGAIDLDGNGFTTNHPDFSKPVLVTSLRFYSKYGNAGQGTGNKYAYGSRVNPGGSVGLGATTSVPGINEGAGDKDKPNAGGMDSVVRDSQGRAQLYPDPTGEEGFLNVNINDIELGEFLDTIFFDKSNRWVKDDFHISYVNQLPGKFKNNLIDTPPTPNPPPLTIPIGMRATDINIDEMGIIAEGVFVIMGKEVFTTGINSFWPKPPNPWPVDTVFVHLDPQASGPDMPFPPNPFLLLGTHVDFSNAGPVAESSTIGTGFWYGCRQQIGNFLFATDKSNNVVKVINSNSMDLITQLTGFSSPDSVAVSSDLRTLYVSNSGSGFLSVFNVDPRTSNFLSHISDVFVGVQPKGICVQPEFEDVFVCNFGSSSISIVNTSNNTVRKTITALLDKPWDMVVGPRQTSFGYQTQVYHGYISNYGGNNVVIYESGPAGLGGVGYDDILDPVPSSNTSGKTFKEIQNPRGLCWDPHFLAANTLTGGAYVAHRSGSFPMVSKIQFTKQQAPAGPIYIIPFANFIGGTPGFGKRFFEITAQWGGTDNPLSPSSGAAADVALIDYSRDLWMNNDWTGNPYVTNYGSVDNNPKLGMPPNHKHPSRILTIFGQTQYHPVAFSDRLFVSYAFDPIMDVINPLDGTVVKTITGLPAPAKVLKSFFKY